MHKTLQRLLDDGDGVVNRRDVLCSVSEPTLQWALKQRQLIRVLPGWYARSTDDASLIRAATGYAGADGALSHTTALWRWGVLTTLRRPLHISVPAARQPRGSRFVTAHRRYGDLPTVVRECSPVVGLDRALLESTPLLSPELGRWALIKTTRERLTTPARLHTELRKMPQLTGKRRLAELIDLLAAGCQSELELFGYTKVFRHPSMPALKSQYPVRLRNRTVYLDLAHEELLVAIELDGAEFHDGREYIERDRRRDVELAANGWVVLRFSARRLREDPAGVRREVLDVLAARRAQLLAS